MISLLTKPTCVRTLRSFVPTRTNVPMHTRGRNKPITAGQVGIRCRWCVPMCSHGHAHQGEYLLSCRHHGIVSGRTKYEYGSLAVWTLSIHAGKCASSFQGLDFDQGLHKRRRSQILGRDSQAIVSLEGYRSGWDSLDQKVGLGGYISCSMKEN